MKNKIRFAAVPLLAAAALILAGCASYTIQPVSSKELHNWNEGKLGAGYVFYQPELYFLVTSTAPKATADATPTNAPPAGDADKSATFSVTPVYLPNPNKPYRVTTFNFLAKSDFTFNFKDGWQLSSIADKADNSSVATALVGQMKTMLDAATGRFFAMKQLPQSFLLHPEYNDDGVITNFTKVSLPDLGK